MSMYISTVSASRRTCLFAGLRHRLRNSCSVVVLGLAGATAFSGAANACQIDQTNPAEVIFSDGATVPCPTQNVDDYQIGANLTITANGKIKGTTITALTTTYPTGGTITNPTWDVGNITVIGTLESSNNSGSIVSLTRNQNVRSVGDVTFQTGSHVTGIRSGSTAIDFNLVPTIGAFTNYGTITAQNTGAVLQIIGGVMTGSLANRGAVSTVRDFLNMQNETVNGDIINAPVAGVTDSGKITIKNGRAFNIFSGTINGNILNSGVVEQTDPPTDSITSRGYQLRGTNVTGAFINDGTIRGFRTGVSLDSVGITGGIVNNNEISGVDTGLEFVNTANRTSTIVNAAGATIKGGINSLKLLQTSGAATVENYGTLDGDVALGTLNTLNINGNVARVIGDTTGTGTSAVNVNGNFTSEGNFTVPTFAVTNGRTILVHNVTANTTSVAAPGTLQIGNNTMSGHVGGNIDNAGSVAFNRSDAYTYGYVISGAGSVTQMGPGTLILTGDQTYTGGTTVSGGTLQLGDGGTTGSVVGNILNNSAVAFNRSDDYTFGAVISGSGSMTQNGPGKLILTGENTYTGGTTVSSGRTLQIGNGATGSLVGDIANGGAVLFNRSNQYIYGGVISGAGTMTQNGPGTLILTGNNTYAGLTTIAAGTLQIGNGGTTGSVASDILNNSALVFNRADTLPYDRVISGTGSVEQKGPGTLILSAAQTYTGGTRVSAGTLKLTGAIISPAIVDSGATFTNEGLVDSTIANNGTLNLDGTRARVTGAVTGAGVVNVNGTFSSENTFAASAFNVNGGGVFNMNNTVTAPVTVANRGLMNVMSAQTVDGNILNNGTINVAGNPLTTTGVYTQTAGATFKTEINYIGPGGYGQLKSAKALDVADGAILFAAFASSEKYPAGTVVQDVLKGTGTPTRAGKITLVTQNQPVDEHYYWSAVWDGVNVDLVLKIYDGALPEPTIRTVKLDKGPILRLMHERFSMLNMVMDYDCAQFDKYGFCLSVQARATGFGTQSSGAGVFNMSYRLADKFRIGGYVDYQLTHNSPSISGYPLENVFAYDNAPTFGGYAGYSETGYTSEPLQKGLQFLASGGVNFGRVSVTRAMLIGISGFLDAQPGSGTARLDAHYVRGMAGYGVDVADGLRVMPYVGLRYTDVTRGGYVESVNTLVTQPLGYDAFYERLLTGFGGAQLAAMLTPQFGARAGLGAEVDFKRAANNYNGVSQIPGLPVFSLEHGGAWNGARPTATAGVFYNITPNQRVFLNGAAGQQAYTTRGYATGLLGYQAAF